MLSHHSIFAYHFFYLHQHICWLLFLDFLRKKKKIILNSFWSWLHHNLNDSACHTFVFWLVKKKVFFISFSRKFHLLQSARIIPFSLFFVSFLRIYWFWRQFDSFFFSPFFLSFFKKYFQFRVTHIVRALRGSGKHLFHTLHRCSPVRVFLSLSQVIIEFQPSHVSGLRRMHRF